MCQREVVAAWTTAVFVFHVSLESFIYSWVPMWGVGICFQSALWAALFFFLLLSVANAVFLLEGVASWFGDSPFELYRRLNINDFILYDWGLGLWML